MKKLSTLLIVFCSCAVLLALTACGGGSTENLRGMYSARLNGFIVQEQVAAEPEMMDEEGGETEEAPAETMEGEGEMAEVEEMPAPNPNIMLDILIQHDSPKILPGVTVDIVMVDANKQEKASWKVWFDTSTVKKANVTQYTHVLEDVPYEEGDGFSAELRHPVPAEERGDYKELSSAG